MSQYSGRVIDVDIQAWKRQQFLDQLTYNLQRAWDREEWTADILGETLADVVPFHLEPETANATLNEILALGVASKHHKNHNERLYRLTAKEYPHRVKARILEAIGA